MDYRYFVFVDSIENFVKATPIAKTHWVWRETECAEYSDFPKVLLSVMCSSLIKELYGAT